ncbi:MAG: LacI family DNA-binding transcriptional regulator [Firmicutes bacterium]|nr:LacI family DNA-binding transcriptional regulator [Bacillota bacterium]
MNIKQIAGKAGVSVATVSRVINHPENVAEATRLKIQKVMEEEGYKPNWFAQGLNFNRTKTIGLIVPHILNPMYMEIAKGIEDVALQKGYITFIGNGEMNPQHERDYVEQLELRKVDGIVIIFSALESVDIKELEQKGMPVVLIGANSDVQEFNMVKVDAKIAAENMVKHLLSCGHRRIAFIQGNDPKAENEAMLEGYCKALGEAGIEFDIDLVIRMDNSIEGGYLGAKRLMSGYKPDVIYAANDNIAFGALDAMKDAGLRVPEDIALAGFGNYRMSNMVEPKLTTSDVPYHKMGVYGARLLFDMIEASDRGEVETQTITLQSKLKVRKSCGHSERIGEMF